MSATRVRREEREGYVRTAGGRVPCLIRLSSARRSLAMRLDLDGRLVLNVPFHAPPAEIDRFLAQHSDWLHAQLATRAPAPSWRDGTRLPWRGGELTLVLDPATTGGGVWRQGESLYCSLPRLQVGEAVGAWYRQQAARLLGCRLAEICAAHGRPLPVWRLSEARSRWGSLSARGVLGLSWRLVKASPAESNYVICHELAHFRRRDHSPAFWREVERLCPDYAAARATLRRQTALYLGF